MALESATYISDLVATNPIGASDLVSQGDDHIRLLKATLQASFVNVNGAVNFTPAQANLLASLSGQSVLGKATTGSGAPAAITAAANGRILGRASDTVQFAVPDTFGVIDASSDQTISGRKTITASTSSVSGGSLILSTTNPRLQVNETDGDVDEKNWLVGANGGGFSIQTSTDATPGQSVNTAIRIDRTGTTVDEIEFNATTFDLNGNIDSDGTVHDINGTTSTTIRGTSSAVVAFTTSGFNADGSLDLDGAVHDLNGTTSVTLTGTANAVIALTTSGISATGVLTTPSTSAQEIGTAGAVARAISSSGNTAATDSGRAVVFTGGSGQTFTLDADVPTNGVVILVNESGNSWTIAASGTLIFAGATGSRTLPTGCMAAAYHRQGTGIWQIAGQLV